MNIYSSNPNISFIQISTPSQNISSNPSPISKIGEETRWKHIFCQTIADISTK